MQWTSGCLPTSTRTESASGAAARGGQEAIGGHSRSGGGCDEHDGGLRLVEYGGIIIIIF